MPSYTHKMATVSWPYILWRHFTSCIRRTTRPPSFSGRSFGRRTVYVMTLCRFPTGRNKASQSIISPVDRRSDRQENRRLPGADARWPIALITISLSPLRVRGRCAEIAAQMAGGTDQRRDIRMPLHGPTRHGSIRPASSTVHGRFSCIHAARKSRFQLRVIARVGRTKDGAKPGHWSAVQMVSPSHCLLIIFILQYQWEPVAVENNKSQLT